MTVSMSSGSLPQPPPGAGLVIVEPSYLWLAFILAFFKPCAAVDGAPLRLEWGATPLPVVPGRHLVEVWCPYLFLSNMGRSGVVVDVAPGAVVHVRWRAPWLVFLRGRIDAQLLQAGAAAPAPAAAPAGWHPDPSGRHELRWFDGTRWTDNVSDHGVAGSDPVGV